MPEKEKDNAQDLLSGLDEMAEEAPGVGLCSLPFKLLRQKAEALIEERNKLAAYREEKPLVRHGNTMGVCPRCGTPVFGVSNFCNFCGQAITWKGGPAWA